MHTNSHCLCRPGRIWKDKLCSQTHVLEQGAHCCGVRVVVVVLAVELSPVSAAALPVSPGCAGQEKAGRVLNSLVPQSMDLVALMSHTSTEGTAQALEGRDRCTLVCAQSWLGISFRLWVMSGWCDLCRVPVVTCPKGVSEYCNWNEWLCQFPWQEQEGCLWQKLLCVCLSSCHLHEAGRTNPRALQHPCAWYQWGAVSVLVPSFLSSLVITCSCLDTHMETQAA